jgi:hypothetical protein
MIGNAFVLCYDAFCIMGWAILVAYPIYVTDLGDEKWG